MRLGLLHIVCDEMHMWQSWIEIEYYSVAYMYFKRITEFDAP